MRLESGSCIAGSAAAVPLRIARGAFKIEEGLAAAGALEPSKCSPIVFHVFAAAEPLLACLVA